MSDYNQLKNAAILNPSTNTDLGSDTNRYSNVFLSGNIVMSNGVTVTSTNVITPKISSITYIGDDTATAPAGGQTITLTGTGFSTGAVVVINNVLASSTTVVSSTQITFAAPAMSAGTYLLYVINSDGGSATFFTGISYSGTPTWTTSAGSLGSLASGASVNITVAATGDAPVRYTIKLGSSLPSGLSLNSTTGVISGTMTPVSSTTVYSFTLTASDLQNQDTDRAFSISAVLAPTIEYLVVAGGGGGGLSNGGGAGAGGLLQATGILATSGVAYSITVGAGGAGGSTYATNGINGANSVISGSGFTTVTAIGGGGGASESSGTQAGSGGSGGGGNGYAINSARLAGSGTSGPPIQGYGGGQSPGRYSTYAAGGGGGAGAVGNNPTTDGVTPGAGGVGVQSSITGTATYYAGGGGGSSNSTGTFGAGGQGGGGAGGHNTSVATGSGAVSTGGGGGGSFNGNNFNGGAGGSGVVIIRYSDAFGAASSTTGSPTVTTAGGYRTYKFTSSGTITF